MKTFFCLLVFSAVFFKAQSFDFSEALSNWARRFPEYLKSGSPSAIRIQEEYDLMIEKNGALKNDFVVGEVNLGYLASKYFTRVMTPEMMETVLEAAGADAVNLEDVEGYPIIYNAVQTRNKALCEFLLRHGADTDLRLNGKPLVFFALSDSKHDILKLLLDAGVDPDEVDENNNGVRPLMCASDLKTIELLLDSGADPDALDASGAPFIFHAVNILSIDELEYLITKRGIRFREADYDGMTLPFVLAKRGMLEKFNYFTEKKGMSASARRCERNDMVFSLLDDAFLSRNSALCDLLLDKGILPSSSNGVNTLSRAIANNADLKTLKRLIDAGADTEYEDNVYRSPLEQAVVKGGAVLDLLLETSPEVDLESSVKAAFACRNMASLRVLLKHGGVLPDEIEGKPLLFLVIENPELFDMMDENILRHDVNVKTFNGITALQYALNMSPSSERYQVVLKLLEAGADPNASNNTIQMLNNTPLTYAVLNLPFDFVKLLTDFGADVNASDSFGLTPLMYAEDERTTEFLLSLKADIRLCDMKGNTALSHSVYIPGKFKLLLKAGADPMTRNVNGVCASFDAAAYDPDVLELVLQSGFDIHERGESGDTVLVSAAAHGNESNVKRLIEKGADVNTPFTASKTQSTPLACAISRNHFKIFKILIDAGANPDDGFSLYAACIVKNYEMVKILLEKGASPNKYEKGRYFSPLGLAVDSCDFILCDMLLKAGADIGSVIGFGPREISYSKVSAMLKIGCPVGSVRQEGGKTLLHVLCESNMFSPHEESMTFDLLAKNMKSLDVRDDDGRTPLMYAALNLKYNMIEKLLKSGADVNLRDADGNTALIHLAGRGMYSMTGSFFKLFKDTNCDFSIRNDKNMNAAETLLNVNASLKTLRGAISCGIEFTPEQMQKLLLSAAYSGNLKMVKEFYDSDKKAWRCGIKSDPSILGAGVAGGNARLAAFIYGTYPSGVKFNECELFSSAAKNGAMMEFLTDVMKLKPDATVLCRVTELGASENTVKRLVEKCACPVVKKKGVTPLHSAASRKDSGVLEYILSVGGRENLFSNDFRGRTPLAVAVECDSAASVKLLLANGAKPEGGMAFEMRLAAASADSVIIKLLVKHGGDIFTLDADGGSLLGIAVRSGSAGTVRYLIECGLDPNERDRKGRTLLQQTIDCPSNAQLKKFKILAESPNMRMILDENLVQAAQKGSYEIVRYLLWLGANADFTDSSGRNAACYVSEAARCSTLDDSGRSLLKLLHSKMKNPPLQENDASQSNKLPLILPPVFNSHDAVKEERKAVPVPDADDLKI